MNIEKHLITESTTDSLINDIESNIKQLNHLVGMIKRRNSGRDIHPGAGFNERDLVKLTKNITKYLNSFEN